MPALTPRQRSLRLAAAFGLAVYGVVRLRNPQHWDLLDDVNLAVHEAGHIVFSPLGDHPSVLGGSLLQIMVPLVFIAYFLRRRDTVAAAVVCAWLAASLGNVALYVADARAQELPLLGGENVIHDWWYLLTEWDLLDRDLAIAGWIRLGELVAFVIAAAGTGLDSGIVRRFSLRTGQAAEGIAPRRTPVPRDRVRSWS